MFRKFIYVLFTVVALMFSENMRAAAYDSEMLIRVGISDSSFSKYIFNDISLYSDSKIEIIDIATGSAFRVEGKDVSFVMNEDGLFDILAGAETLTENLYGPISVNTVPNSLIGVRGLIRAGKPAFYRGAVELVKSQGKQNGFAVVNVLDLKSYLKGVVPNEMPVSFGLEALKAQCVAARNYALKPRDKAYKEFDICDSVACQVYFGAKTERELSSRAVDETDGLVALYDSDLILAVYSSTAGGYTESYSNAFSSVKTNEFPGNEVPYLIARPDIPDMKPLNTEEAAREFYTSNPDTYDNNSSYFRWKREWTLSEFTEMLNETMLSQSKFVKPYFTEDDLFDTLKEIRILQRGNSGKVIFLEIITDKGSYIVGKELVLRRLFKKNGKALPSANFVTDLITDETSEPVIRFTGGGFGHGVGMSQYGAGKMGQTGMSFVNILQHYYSGISLGTVPVTLEPSYGKNSYSESFYAPSSEVSVYIDENKGISDISVIVNGVDLNTDLNGFFKKKTKIDISKYIHRGINNVEVVLPDEHYGSNKLFRYHIEVAGVDKNG